MTDERVDGTGASERGHHAKENLLWLRRFDTVEDLRRALHAFKEA